MRLKHPGFVTLAFLLTVLSGCAGKPQQEKLSAEDSYAVAEVNDPLEPMNRCVFKFNQVVDGVLIKPIAIAYKTVTPKPVRKGVSNFLDNLTSPVSFANAVAQGNPEQAFSVFWRFVLNTTLGVGGIFDFAGYHGLNARSEDFGQTMGYYGMGHGAYLVLPLLGPSSLRDATGRVADLYIDPLDNFMSDEQRIGISTATVIDTRASKLKITEEIDRTSIDPYATYRSAYFQYRANEVRNGK